MYCTDHVRVRGRIAKESDRRQSFISASPPLPPPPETAGGGGGAAFDYPQVAPLPPPEFSDTSEEDSRSQAAPPEDPYAATGPGFLGPDTSMPANYIEKGGLGWAGGSVCVCVLGGGEMSVCVCV